MTLAAAIVVLLGGVVPLIVWMIRRHVERSATPQETLKRYEEDARKVIAQRDVDGVNCVLDDRLRALRRNSVGPAGGEAPSGPDRP